MNAKNTPAGAPNVIYLSPLLDEWLGAGAARVILPITDPYVVHHGALGSFATVYLRDAAQAPAVLARLRTLPGIEYAAGNAEACARFELPPDRLGQVIVVSTRDTALGKAPSEHDLSQLEGGLRSHGGLAEQRVPFVLSAPVSAPYRARAEAGSLRNFDLFDFALNGVE
jgi:phosphonoacetate hydrolase